MTLAEVLRDAASRLQAAGIEEARLEAEVLLCHAAGLRREELFARLREALPEHAGCSFHELLERRLAHEPTAYIVGHREFYGLELACTAATLIPRPETELLVETALDWLASRPVTRGPRPTVADVGAGNGAISVALAVHAPGACIVAIDPSRRALQLARRNARMHGVTSQVAFVQGELLAPARSAFDLIVANLPYVSTRLYEKLPPEIREHEPALALHAGPRGTALIETLLRQSRGMLRLGGLLLAEHAWNQGRRLREAASAAFPAAGIETRRDLAGRERMLVVRTN